MSSGLGYKWNLQWMLASVSILVSCGESVISDHSEKALLHSVEIQRLDPHSGEWVVESRMSYHYNVQGQITAKWFHLRNQDSLSLALRYHLSYPSEFLTIEDRDDCEGNVCKPDTRKVVRKDLLARNYLDSTYTWDSSLAQWISVYTVEYRYGKALNSDTILYLMHGKPVRRVTSALHSHMKRKWEEAMDSNGQWKKVRGENCTMRSKLPLHCIERVEGMDSQRDTWTTYTPFDSVSTVRSRSTQGEKAEIFEYDIHNHLIRSRMGDTLQVIRRYQ